MVESQALFSVQGRKPGDGAERVYEEQAGSGGEAGDQELEQERVNILAYGLVHGSGNFQPRFRNLAFISARNARCFLSSRSSSRFQAILSLWMADPSLSGFSVHPFMVSLVLFTWFLTLGRLRGHAGVYKEYPPRCPLPFLVFCAPWCPQSAPYIKSFIV